MFFLRRQVKKCKIHKKLKLFDKKIANNSLQSNLSPSPFGKLDWLNLTILAVSFNPIMCYDLEK